MGYAAQMPRAFSTIELIGAGFSVTASWVGVAGGFSTGVLIGGPVSLVYGLIIIAILQLFVATSLAELVSAMPNAGGQYYWAMRLAPKKLARFSAYSTGVFNLAGGICAAAANCVLLGYMVLGCVVLYNPDL
jgi:choline transport protein